MKEKIYEILDTALDEILEIGRTPRLSAYKNISAPNALFSNKRGTEKMNQLVKEWAKENNLNLFVVTPSGKEITINRERLTIDHIDDSFIAPTKEEIDALNKKHTVLFLEDFHQYDSAQAYYLLKLVNDRIVIDKSAVAGYSYLDEIMFTIATVGDMGHGGLSRLINSDSKNCFYYISKFEE